MVESVETCVLPHILSCGLCLMRRGIFIFGKGQVTCSAACDLLELYHDACSVTWIRTGKEVALTQRNFRIRN